MKILFSFALFALAAAAWAEAGPSTRREAQTQWSQAGLQRTDVRGMDLAYQRSGVSLAPYRRVMLRPVGISFQRNWVRTAGQNMRSPVPPRDLQRLVDELSVVVREQAGRELERGGYALADAPGPDVLEIDLRVTELSLNAPDFPTAGRTRSYSQSYGELNLVADLRDSVSGEVLMSVFDHNLGRDFQQLRLTTRADNVFEVGLVAREWARALHRQLELARTPGQGSNDRP